VIYTGPTKATAEGQIEIINSLIDQKVGCIAISANDPDAVAPALEKAMSRGIKVISWDSGVTEKARMLHLNPSDTGLIGETIIKLLLTICQMAAKLPFSLLHQLLPIRIAGLMLLRKFSLKSSPRSNWWM